MADTPGRQPIPPDKRRRLQQWFESANKSVAANDFKYAEQMFDQCVQGDPSNNLYIKQYLNTLGKKYKDNKKGAGFTSLLSVKSTQAFIKKAAYSQNWQAVLDKGWEVLKLNPWETSTLTAMGDACAALHMDEAQLVYLKQALDVAPNDADVNRKCGRALASLGQFDLATKCFNKVLQLKPGDEEAIRAIGNLAINKTISKGKYEEAESGQDVRADKGIGEVDNKLTPQQRIEKQISKNPGDVNLYLELAELHTREERYAQAEEALRKACDASGGDIAIRERLEDAQLRGKREQVEIAKRKAQKERTPEALELYKKMKAELNLIEMEAYRNRSERYPTILRHKYELGLRQKAAGQYQEAIKSFQAALGDPKLRPRVHMELGDCFQAIKQYKLAMQNFEASLEGFTIREPDDRKSALYRAGRLSLALAERLLTAKDPQAKDELARSENLLNELASLEFGYKDVPDLLDKLAKIRDKG